jgi:peptide/nickel transport system permease protein
MFHYLVRRLLLGFVTLVLISFVIFGLIRNMPGTPLTLALAEIDPSRSIREEDLERMKKSYGLDKPWPVAYVQWLGNLAQGDLGRSISRKQPVVKLIGERVGPTLLLSATSLFLAYLLAVPMGLFATVRSGKPDERALSTTLYMLYSLPSFVAALLLLVFFSVKLEGTPLELPLFGMVSDGYAEFSPPEKVWDVFRHMILPVTCFTYGSLAYFSRFVKSNMEEVVRQDYIRTARAKGVGPFRVVVHHAFRNTLIPFVTLMGLTLPALLSGSVILEQIFSWPGMGRLFFEAITERDYPTIMGLTLMFSVLTLLGQLLADILYAVVDPRVTYS